MIFNEFTMHLEYKYITHHHKVKVGDWVMVLRSSHSRGVWQTTAFWGEVKAKPTKGSLMVSVRASDLFVQDHTGVWDRPKKIGLDGVLTVRFSRDVIFQWRASEAKPLLFIDQRVLRPLMLRTRERSHVG